MRVIIPEDKNEEMVTLVKRNSTVKAFNINLTAMDRKSALFKHASNNDAKEM